MSWQDYVDTSLVGTGKIAHAAIIGHDGTVWAQSGAFVLAPEEIACLLRAYANPSTLYEHGLTLAGTRYVYLRGDERSIYLRKGNVGVCCVKTAQCILVALYDTSDQKVATGEATKIVEDLGDYLIGVGY